SASVPLLQERAAFVVRLLRTRVEQIVRRVAIHHRLADDSAESATLHFVEKDVRRLRMNRREDERGERAVPTQFVVEGKCEFARVLGIFDLALGRNSVAVQLLVEMCAVRADHYALRRMQMIV